MKKLKDKSSEHTRLKEYRANFVAVASRAASSHRSYNRDLVHLLTLSMEIDDFDLSLSIGTLPAVVPHLQGDVVTNLTLSFCATASEILDHPVLSSDLHALSIVLESVRKIAELSLKIRDSAAARSMRRVLKLFHKASNSEFAVVREEFDVPEELSHFIQRRSASTEDKLDPEQLELVDFFAKEAAPHDLLRALTKLKEVSGYQTEILPALQTLLQRAANESVSSEMSIALMKVKHARMDIEQNIDSHPMFEDAAQVPSQSLWQNMSHGMIAVAK